MNIDIKKEVAPQAEWLELNTGAMLSRCKWLVINHWLSYWKEHMLRYQIRTERLSLARLSDRELKDIGIDRAEAMAESQRRYSDLPDSRSS